MRLQHVFLGLMFLCLSGLIVVAGDKANFNGQWIMDKSKSEGLPPDMEQRMKVTHEGDRVEIETDLYQGDNVQTVPDQYVLDGKEVEYTTHLPSGEETKAKRIAKWNAEGNGFEARDVAAFDLPDGKITITTVRKWTMAADGKSLVIEIMRTGPNGTSSSKRLFTKK